MLGSFGLCCSWELACMTNWQPGWTDCWVDKQACRCSVTEIPLLTEGSACSCGLLLCDTSPLGGSLEKLLYSLQPSRTGMCWMSASCLIKTVLFYHSLLTNNLLLAPTRATHTQNVNTRHLGYKCPSDGICCVVISQVIYF